MLKDPKFEWEKEHRFIMKGYYNPKTGKRALCELPTEKFRTLGTYSCSHFCQSFDSTELKEIVLGKEVNSNLENELQDRLNKNDYDLQQISIFKSKV